MAFAPLFFPEEKRDRKGKRRRGNKRKENDKKEKEKGKGKGGRKEESKKADRGWEGQEEQGLSLSLESRI